MRPPIHPKIHNWYRLPDGDMFRVSDIDEEFVKIQYSDGALEDVDMETWHKLDVINIEPTEEWLELQENSVHELDYFNLGVAPGSEGIGYMNLYNELDNH